MTVIELLRQQLQSAHQILEGTMADVTPEQAHWLPPGVANPLGASYAHLLMSEDGLLNGIVRGAAPLSAGEWGAKMGLSAPPPLPGDDWAGWAGWARSVNIDLAALRAYGQAVYAATDAYMASLTPAELDRPVKFFEFPEMPLGAFVGNIVIGHVNNHAGEISALKGFQGAKGYPF